MARARSEFAVVARYAQAFPYGPGCSSPRRFVLLPSADVLGRITQVLSAHRSTCRYHRSFGSIHHAALCASSTRRISP